MPIPITLVASRLRYQFIKLEHIDYSFLSVHLSREWFASLLEQGLTGQCPMSKHQFDVIWKSTCIWMDKCSDGPHCHSHVLDSRFLLYLDFFSIVLYSVVFSFFIFSFFFLCV